MKFELKTLNEISGGGSYGLGASASETPIGPKFLRTTDIVRGRIDWADVPFCEADTSTIHKYRLSANDIVISRTGANAGLNCLVTKPPTDAIFAGYLVRFQIDKKIADAHYVSYVLRSSTWDEYVANTRTGSAQPQLNAVLMGEFSFSLPPLKTQRAISQMLMAFDEKIESNERLAQTLEQIAQTVFRSWFIDFEPVKAKMSGEKPVGMDDATAALFPNSMEDSELGPIPKGWEIRSIDSFGKVVTGKTPSTKNAEYWGEEIPFVTIPDMHDQGLIVDTKRFLSKRGADSQKNQYLPKGSTLVSCIATPGLVAYATEMCQSNQQINSVIPNDEHPSSWLYWHLKNMIPAFVNRSGIGTVFPNLNKSDFSSIQSIVPTKEIRIAYAGLVDSFFRKIEGLRRETHSLESLRESLLPRLISGELQIPQQMLVAS